MRFARLSSHCVGQNKFQKKYAIICSNQHKDEYNIHELENSKISDLCRLMLNLTDKMDLPRGDKRVAFSDLSIYYTWKNMKKSY